MPRKPSLTRIRKDLYSDAFEAMQLRDDIEELKQELEKKEDRLTLLLKRGRGEK